MLRSAKYRGVPCRIIPYKTNEIILEFDVHPRSDFTPWAGKYRGKEDPSEVVEGKWYYYFMTDGRDDKNDLVICEGYSCDYCNNGNCYAEANLTRDRHLCFACCSTERWRYQDDFLPGTPNYREPERKPFWEELEST